MLAECMWMMSNERMAAVSTVNGHQHFIHRLSIEQLCVCLSILYEFTDDSQYNSTLCLYYTYESLAHNPIQEAIVNRFIH